MVIPREKNLVSYIFQLRTTDGEWRGEKVDGNLINLEYDYCVGAEDNETLQGHI